MSLRLKRFEYKKGWHSLGHGCYAWLQPDGSWGLSNAGLITDGEETLLVDSLYDWQLTGEMLEAMKKTIPATQKGIATIVNTHSNGDHCNGNALVGAKEIISSQATLVGMAQESPQLMLKFLAEAPSMGEFGKYFQRCFSRYNFQGIEQQLPNITFQGRLEKKVGNKKIELIQVGPAHTAGDTIVHVPEAKIVYAGDILFIEGHPLMWVGPVENWLKALQLILDLKPDIVVPGHGPITDARGVQAVKDYFHYVMQESRKHFEVGKTIPEAMQAMMPGKYAQWLDGERLAVNIAMLYRQFKGDQSPANMIELFGLMSQFAKQPQSAHGA